MLDKVRNKDKAWVKKHLDDFFLTPYKNTRFERLQTFSKDLSEKYPGAANLLETSG